MQFNPIDGCQYSSELSAQLNLTNDHKRKKHHTCKHVLSPDHMSMPDMWSVSWAALKKGMMLSRLQATDPCITEIGDPTNSGQLFNQTTSTGWDAKQGQQFTLLRRITNSKVSIQRSFYESNVSLERLSPKGSCHLDESSMNHTLAQKHLIELLMWNASHVQEHLSKPDRNGWMIRSEKLCEGILSTSLLEGLTWFWCNSVRLRKPYSCLVWKQLEKRHAGTWLSRLPLTKMKIGAGTRRWSISASPIVK